MKPVHKALWKWALLVCFVALPARAQEPQFLPEIDAHLKLASSVRAYLQAKDDRDGGDPTQFTIGPSIQYYLKPLLRLRRLHRLIWMIRNQERWSWKLDTDTSPRRVLRPKIAWRQLRRPIFR
jgi:hypothetical protein